MRFLTIYRHWFECFGSTKHISTWQNICEQLGIDDDPEKDLNRNREIMSNTYELPPLDMIG